MKDTRFYSLDAFRGLAALSICLYHMPANSSITATTFIRNAGVLVDLFFILSGFILYYKYGNQKIKTIQEVKQFLIKRGKRIIPLHIYTLLVLFVLELLKYINPSTDAFSKNNIAYFFTQLLLLNATPLFTDFSWNGANWSISAEMICYLIFAFSSIYLMKSKTKSIAVLIGYSLLGFLFFKMTFTSFNLVIDFNYSFIRALIGFCSGALTYIIYQSIYPLAIELKKQNITVLELLACSGVGIVVYHFEFLKPFYYLIILAFCFAVLVFAFEKGKIAGFLKQDIFQKLGLWSYSIYLNHILILRIGNYFVKNRLQKNMHLNSTFIMIEVVLLLLICMYSKYTHKYIEKLFYTR